MEFAFGLFDFNFSATKSNLTYMEEDRLKRLGAYIKLLRESLGMSQDELAKKSGFSGRQAISVLENGRNNISIDRLVDLAVALKTTPSDLMDILMETSDIPLTEGLNSDNLAKLRSYADYLRNNQGE